jgi:hypothetical protein
MKFEVVQFLLWFLESRFIKRVLGFWSDKGLYVAGSIDIAGWSVCLVGFQPAELACIE